MASLAFERKRARNFYSLWYIAPLSDQITIRVLKERNYSKLFGSSIFLDIVSDDGKEVDAQLRFTCQRKRSGQPLKMKAVKVSFQF